MQNNYDTFKYLWSAKFSNGHIVKQHPQDIYSKHDPNASYNPSSFRDFKDYMETHPKAKLVEFRLANKEKAYVVSFEKPERPVIYYEENNRYGIKTKHFDLVKCKRDLKNTRPIYFRRVELNQMTGERRILHYILGFQGNENNGRNYQKTTNVL